MFTNRQIKLGIILLLLILLIFILVLVFVYRYRYSNKNYSNTKEDISSINKTEELVVAVCNEDIDWIKNYVNDFKLITIYNKCGKNIKFNNENIKVIDTPNIGSCDYAFLSYIIERYHDLPDFVEFTKGWVLPKRKYNNCLPCKFNKYRYNELMNFKLKDYAFTYKKNNTNIPFQVSKYKNMEEWIKDQEFSTNDYKMSMCNIIYKGNFGATKDQILKTPKKIWISLRNQQKYPNEEVDHFIERTWRVLLCKPLYNLVIVAIFKNESVAMREWLSHYTKQGVDHFYMIDNGSTDDWENQVEGFPVTIYSDSTKHKQADHYNNYFLEEVKMNSNWVMVVDLDEFIYARNHFKTIPEYLNTLNDDIGCVTVAWKMFGSNSHIYQPTSIVKGFTRRRKHEANITNKLTGYGLNGVFDFGKSICRTLNLVRIDIHIPKHDGKQIIIPDKVTENSLAGAPLHLNHYTIQSWNWFSQVKMTRGDAVNSSWDNTRTVDFFKSNDHTEIEDTELSDNYHNYDIVEKNKKDRIPKIINKVYINDLGTLIIDDCIKEAHNSWTEKNKEYKLKLWALNDCRKYLQENFPSYFIETFDHLIPYSYKCDFFRYCIIYREGGWYSDWSQVCLVNNLLNKLVINYEDNLIYFEDKDGMDLYIKKFCSVNGFFGSEPYNPILKKVIEQFVINTNTKYYGQTILSPSGPGLFGEIIKKYSKIEPSGYYKQNYFYHKNFGVIIQHKHTDVINNGYVDKFKNGNDYRMLWKEKQCYKEDNDWYYKEYPSNIALLFTMYNEKSRNNMYNDVLNYYVNEIKYPKQNIFIVDSSGNGVSEDYVYKENQLVYNQNNYKHLLTSLPYRYGPTNYEIVALKLSSTYFNFKNFKYIVKITCKYKIPEIYQLNYLDSDKDLILQQNNDFCENNYQSSEILCIKSSKLYEIIDIIYNSKNRDNLESILHENKKNFYIDYLPYLSNTANYKRSDDKSLMKCLSKE